VKKFCATVALLLLVGSLAWLFGAFGRAGSAGAGASRATICHQNPSVYLAHIEARPVGRDTCRLPTMDVPSGAIGLLGLAALLGLALLLVQSPRSSREARRRVHCERQRERGDGRAT
jgi:hypothetical protein